MKALVVTPYYHPRIGGLENYARQLNIALNQQAQWEVAVVASGTPADPANSTTIDGHRIYRLQPWFKLSNTPFNPLWPRQMRRIVRREQPDVIIAHTPVPSMADAMALARGRTPFVVFYHAATLLKAGSPLFNLAARLYMAISMTALKRADHIFAVSPFVRAQLAPHLQTKTTVIPNAVWHAEIVPRKQPAQPKELLFIASLARSHAWKGLSDILQAITVYQTRYGGAIHLTVVGDGDARSRYEAEATSLGISQLVRFVGAQTGDRKQAYLREAAAMLIYPTTENDAFPTVMLEAWAAHVPVIVARIGALADLVEDDTTGLLCEAKDPDTLADTIHHFLSLSLAARDRIARSAAEQTRAHFTWERQADTLCNQLKELR